MMPCKLWSIVQQNPVLADFRKSTIADTFQISYLTAQLLLNRGFLPMHDKMNDSAREFMSAGKGHGYEHSPLRLPGVENAIGIIAKAMQNNRQVWIYGDYDVDGVSGSCLLYHALRTLYPSHITPKCMVPHRHNDGYGLHYHLLQQIARETPGALVITVDCGITAVGIAARVRRESLPIQLIITDHHQPQDELPAADCVVHPRISEPHYPAPLCGAGVAYKLAQGCFYAAGKQSQIPSDLLALAALGTVCDLVPLVNENRSLVANGLKALKYSTNPGIQALLLVSGLAGESAPEITSEDLGFQLGPRLNAMGRLHDATFSLELFTTINGDRALGLAQSMDKMNQQRKLMERQIYEQAKSRVQSDKSAVILHDPSWDGGVIGIVAGKLAEELKRPVLLATSRENGDFSGSARAGVAGFAMNEVLAVCKPNMADGSFGGHEAAAGFHMPPHAWASFEDAFQQAAHMAMANNKQRPDLTIEAVVQLRDLSLTQVRDIYQLAPFGMGNKPPVLAAFGVRLDFSRGGPKAIGKDQSHLQIGFTETNAESGSEHSIKGVGFGQAWRLPHLVESQLYDIAFVPKMNHWLGRTSVQLEIRDIQEHADI